eukprot:4056644-Pleurochrysis_carterae.AAC.2
MSSSLRPPSSMYTVLTASSASVTIIVEKRETNLVPVQLCTSFESSAVSLMSRGLAIVSRNYERQGGLNVPESVPVRALRLATVCAYALVFALAHACVCTCARACA